MAQYQYEYIDACIHKSVRLAGDQLLSVLLGSNFKGAGESDTVNGTTSPSAGQRGYTILQTYPRLADGFDSKNIAENFVKDGGGGSPWPWYADARAAWYGGINSTFLSTFSLSQYGPRFTVADPIAQSFFVTGKTVVLSKIDVYFRNKDENLPVYVDIRRNIAGVPGPEVIPFSTSVLYPEMVLTSEDSSVPTTFIFDGLVHLEEGEYSVVLRTDSTAYEVFVSTQNEQDILRKTKITTQPNLGSFFKSQNLSTWTPDQLTDLKFTLYRANFNTSGMGIPVFSLHPNHFKTMALQENPFEFYPGSQRIRVLAPGHGMKNGDNVIVDASAYTSNIFVDNVNTISGTYVVLNSTDDDFIIQGRARGNASVISKPTRGGGTGVVLRDSHHFVFDTIFPEVAFYAGQGANDWGIGGGWAAYKVLDANSRTYSYGQLQVNRETSFDTTKVVLNPTANNTISIPDINPLYPQVANMPETLVLMFPLVSNDSYASPLIDRKKIKINLIKSLSDNATFQAKHTIPEDYNIIASNSYNITIEQVNNLTGLGRAFLTNGAEVANTMTIVPGSYISISANTNSGMYRVLSTDSDSTNANIFFAKIGNTASDANVFAFTPNVVTANSVSILNGRNFIDERAPRGGSAKTKYLTKEIKFANPSSSLYFKLDVHKPEGTTFKFLYRTKPTGDIQAIEDKDFEEFPAVAIPTPLNENEYFEVETQVDNLPTFESVQIKIVYYMDRYAGRAPKAKNLRVISLA